MLRQTIFLGTNSKIRFVIKRIRALVTEGGREGDIYHAKCTHVGVYFFFFSFILILMISQTRVYDSTRALFSL